MDLKELLRNYSPLVGWFGYSILCLLAVLIMHPLVLSQTDNVALLSGQYSNSYKVKYEDVGGGWRNPEAPYYVEIVYTVDFSGFAFMEPIDANAICSVSNFEFSGAKFSRSASDDLNYLVALKIPNDSSEFDRIWQSDINEETTTIRFQGATIRKKHGTFFAVMFWITTYLGAAPFIAVLAGLLVAAIIALFVVGYTKLPLLLKVALWIFGFPIMLLIFGVIGGNGGGSADRVFDENDKVVGYYDEKSGVYRDSSGKIRSPKWWLRKK